MAETVKLISKLLLLSTVSLFGFSTMLNETGRHMSRRQASNLETQNWNLNCSTAAENFSARINSESRIPEMIDIVDDAISNDTALNPMNSISESISKITSVYCSVQNPGINPKLGFGHGMIRVKPLVII